MKYLLPLLVTFLAIQTVSSQFILLSGLCVGKTCTSTIITALLGATTQLQIDVGFTVDSDTTLQAVTTSGSGTLTVASNAALQISSTLTVAASTTATIAGSLVVQGSASVSGSMQIGSSGSSNNASATFQSSLSLQSSANFVVYGAATVSGALNVAANSVVNIAAGGVATVNSNVNNVQGTVTVSGTLDVNSGASSSTYTQTGGALILGDSNSASTSTGVMADVYIDAEATLSGTGNINGALNLVGNSTISPGNSPGTSYVNGDVHFSSTSTYKFEVDNDNNKHDLIVATGTAYLNGYVHCTFLNSVPGSNSYTALTYSSRSGTFSHVYGDILQLTRWSENDNTAISTQFAFSNPSSAAATTFSLAVLLLGLVASLL